MSALDVAIDFVVGRGARRFEVHAEFTLEDGVLVLFGPSGAGKSLTLQALAGLFRPTAGHVRVGAETLFGAGVDVSCHARRVGYVPQQHALFPFLDVAGNVGFSLPRAERRRASGRVAELLEAFSLTPLAAARPESLSGGERQRVALARAVALEPRLLLLDEPFASIDPLGRAELRRSLAEHLTRLAIPTVLVTHDIGDALSLGDQFVPMVCGKTAAPVRPEDHFGIARLAGRIVAREVLADGRVRVRLADAEVMGPASETGADGRLERFLYED